MMALIPPDRSFPVQISKDLLEVSFVVLLDPVAHVGIGYCAACGCCRLSDLTVRVLFLCGREVQFEPPHVGCYGLKRFSTFAFTVVSILMSGDQGGLEPSPRSLFFASRHAGHSGALDNDQRAFAHSTASLSSVALGRLPSNVTTR